MREFVRRTLGSVRIRLTLAAMVTFGVAFAVASVALVNRVQSSLEDDVRQSAGVAIRDAASELRAGAEPDTIFFSQPPVYGVVYDSDGEIVYETAAMRPNDGLLTYRRVAVAGQPFTIAVASPLDGVRRSVDALARALWLITPALVAAVGVLSWRIAGRALRPVEMIRAEVDEITHTTMHRRVPVPLGRDEVQRLAVTMNDMLDRLERSSARQREFVSDASHELRSPIASMQTELEVALRSAEPPVWPVVADRVLGESRRLGSLVDDLLVLARLDERPLGAHTEVDVDELVLADVARRAGRIRFDTGIVRAGRVLGNQRQLAAVVRNLLDNAARHARTTVAVGVEHRAGDLVLVVHDDGPGIPVDDRARVFERFTRLDEGRARDAGGAGLGLALVRRVVEAHGGTVHIGDSPLGGTRFEVRLPGHRDATVGAFDLTGDEARQV